MGTRKNALLYSARNSTLSIKMYVQIRPLHVKHIHILPLWGSNASQNEHIDNSTGSEDLFTTWKDGQANKVSNQWQFDVQGSNGNPGTWAAGNSVPPTHSHIRCDVVNSAKQVPPSNVNLPNSSRHASSLCVTPELKETWPVYCSVLFLVSSFIFSRFNSLLA